MVLPPDLLGVFSMNFKKRLGENDAKAVDLLLDRTSSATNGSSSGAASPPAGNGNGLNVMSTAEVFASPIDDEVIKRVGAVETVLRLLAEMPAPDPPSDLVQRTLDRIRVRTAAVPRTTSEQPGPHPIIGHGPPHA
jgi:hypothetical protein